MKQYDERYFKRWYHSAGSRIVSAAERARRVSMVVSMAEFILGRPLRSVLDIGCGEAHWQPVIHQLRKSTAYVGMDSSEYAVKRYGRSRGIVQGTFSQIEAVVPQRTFDLVIASDVIHYLTKAELESGLSALASRVGGVAYLDFFTSRDSVEGDMKEMKLRPPQYYRRLFKSRGLQPLGMQFHAPTEIAENLTSMESHHSVRSIP